jgi:lysophospholipase L1-like esterase
VVTSPIRAYGDSLTVGVGASTKANSYLQRFSADTGCAVENFGVSGAQAADLGAAVYRAVTAPGQVFLYATGVNDERSNRGDLGELADMASTQLAQLAWLAIPDSLKVRARSNGPTYSGTTWSSTAVYGLGMRATAGGDTATYRITGHTIYLALIQQDGDLGQAIVGIDGVVRTTVSTAPAAPLHTINGLTYAPQAIRISGLADGPHTVTVSITTNEPTWPVYVDWIAGISGPVDGPLVLVGNTIPCRGCSAGGSDQTVQAVNAYTADVVRQLAADGLHVRLVDVHDGFDPETDLSADGYHPNDRGHAKIARAFEAAMHDVTCQTSTN